MRQASMVIGEGCVGAGILYGLAKRGWGDVVLLERTQLTAGSTRPASRRFGRFCATASRCWARSITPMMAISRRLT